MFVSSSEQNMAADTWIGDVAFSDQVLITCISLSCHCFILPLFEDCFMNIGTVRWLFVNLTVVLHFMSL